MMMILFVWENVFANQYRSDGRGGDGGTHQIPVRWRREASAAMDSAPEAQTHGDGQLQHREGVTRDKSASRQRKDETGPERERRRSGSAARSTRGSDGRARLQNSAAETGGRAQPQRRWFGSGRRRQAVDGACGWGPSYRPRYLERTDSECVRRRARRICGGAEDGAGQSPSGESAERESPCRGSLGR